MNNFKLNYYFQIYKDKPLPSREEFRCYFRKNYGEFEYLNELIIKIENYQMKRYGQTLYYDGDKNRNKKRGKYDNKRRTN